MAEPRFNNPYFWPPPPTMPSQLSYNTAAICQGMRNRFPTDSNLLGEKLDQQDSNLQFSLDNLVLINKIKEQLMAEKIRPPHMPPTSVPSQQPLLVPPSETSQSVMTLQKLHQVSGLHSQSVPQPDIALHARPANGTVPGSY